MGILSPSQTAWTAADVAGDCSPRLAGNDSFARRLTDETNRKAFDRDADPCIERVAAATFVPLGSHLAAARLTSGERAELEALHNEARRVFTLFLHSHRGAIKRHTPASFSDPCPTDPALTNHESIRESIGDMAMRPARARTVDHADRLPTLTLSGDHLIPVSGDHPHHLTKFPARGGACG